MDRPTASCRDALTGALIGLSRAMEGKTHPTAYTFALLCRGLAASADPEPGKKSTEALIDEIHREKERLVPRCGICSHPCGRNNDYDMQAMNDTDDETCLLRSAILTALQKTAQQLEQDREHGNEDPETERFLADALFRFGKAKDLAALRQVMQDTEEKLR